VAFSRVFVLRSALALALVSGAALAHGQEEPEQGDENKPNPWFVRAAYVPGLVLGTTDFVKGDNAAGQPIDRAQAFSVELGWQTDGSRDWQRRYNLPALGVGVYHAEFNNGEELGAPTAVYSWFSWPLARLGSRVDLKADFGLGVAFGWNPFDPDTNPFNHAVSTRVTAYTEVGLYTDIVLDERWRLRAGGVFKHFSNGGTGDPNGAVNLLSPVIGVRYDFARSRAPYERVELPPVPKFWELAVSGGIGVKTVDLARDDPDAEEGRYEPERFYAGGVTVEISRRLHAMSRLGAGVDIMKDGSANASLDSSAAVPGSEKLAVGIYGGYEHVIDRFSIPAQIGYYVWRGRDDERIPELYQKLGFKFDISDRFFVGMDARFYDFSRADFLRWTVGFRFHRFGWSPASAGEP